jgi:ATP-dependent Clp protease ATP-binding subunit ClpC
VTQRIVPPIRACHILDMARSPSELDLAFTEAQDIAVSVGQRLSSAHLFLALFTLDNGTSQFLKVQGLHEDSFLALMGTDAVEPAGKIDDLHAKALELSTSTGSAAPLALHALLALCRDRTCIAHQLMSKAGVDVATLRTEAMAAIIRGATRTDSAPNGQPYRPETPVKKSFTLPSFVGNPKRHETAHEPRTSLNVRAQQVSVHGHGGGHGGHSTHGVTGNASQPYYTATSPGVSPGPTTPRRAPPVSPGPPAPPAPVASPVGFRRGPAASPPGEAPAKPKSPAQPPHAPNATQPGDATPPSPGATEPRRRSRLLVSPSDVDHPASTGATETTAAADPKARYRLDPKQYPWLVQLGRNLSESAAEGRFDPLIGRDREIEEVIDILGKRRSNNPLLLGEPGVGKTAIVEGLARALVFTPTVAPTLADKVFVELDMNRITAGTSLRGAFAERLTGLRDEVKKANGRIVVFFDEIHTLMGAGGGDSPEEATNALKSALARGEFPCIGATTNDEFKKFIESDPAFERRFDPVLVREPSPEDALAILKGMAPAYEAHHGVQYEAQSLDAAVRFSSRFISERFLPDKAFKLVDIAGSRARRRGAKTVGVADIAAEVARVSGVPAEKLMMSDADRLLRMEKVLGAALIGHEGIVQRVAAVIRRNYAGFHARRPIGSFLFLGPTGVGKTELAKQLADFMFGSPDALVRIDMSEYEEPHAVARLIGAPPGYVGHEAGGQLTEALRKKPFQIILLDEVEKAHRDILQILLQVLDEGRLTDARGRTIDFTNAIIIMTSNLGAEVLGGQSAPTIGFRPAGFGASQNAASGVATLDRVATANDTVVDHTRNDTLPDVLPVGASDSTAPLSPLHQAVIDEARRFFSPELWNRIEDKLVFAPLTRDQLRRIAVLEAERSSQTLSAERQIRYTLTTDAVEWLLDNGGYDPAFGARPLRQTLQRRIESRIAEGILRREFKPGDELRVTVIDGKLLFATVARK